MCGKITIEGGEYMRIVLKNPQQLPNEIEIDNTLHTLQQMLGGYIEIVRLPTNSDIAIIVNDSGKLIGLPPNLEYEGDILVGPVIFTGVDGEDLVSVTDVQVRQIYDYLKHNDYWLEVEDYVSR